MMLNVSDLTVAFGSHTVLHRFSFDLSDGEIACLLGSSGCGKTTALRAIAGFESPQSGTILLHNRELSGIPPHKRGIGMVFQDYALFPHLNIAENIAFGLHKHSKTEKKQRIGELLALIKLEDSAKKYPHQLSGGQQQRVALARALAPKPALILMDEPFSNLDADLRHRLSKDVRELLKQQQTAALLVTHDQQEAFAMADRIAVMQAGRLKQYASAQELYARPNSPEVAAFIGEGSLLDGQIFSDGLITSAAGSLRTALPNNAHKVKLFVRPADVAPEPNAATQALIVEMEYKGSYYNTVLTLDNGEKLLMHLPADTEYRSGQRIAVSLKNTPCIFPA